MYYRSIIRFITNNANKIYFVNTPKKIIKNKNKSFENKNKSSENNNKFIKVIMSESHNSHHYIKDKNSFKTPIK
tara:strand:- start:119 stop:340 length:222 start_codon:yes stop_codon:yes gene_type:complete